MIISKLSELDTSKLKVNKDNTFTPVYINISGLNLNKDTVKITYSQFETKILLSFKILENTKQYKDLITMFEIIKNSLINQNKITLDYTCKNYNIINEIVYAYFYVPISEYNVLKTPVFDHTKTNIDYPSVIDLVQHQPLSLLVQPTKVYINNQYQYWSIQWKIHQIKVK